MARGYAFDARAMMIGRRATVSEAARPGSLADMSIVAGRVDDQERGREIGLLPGAGVPAMGPRCRGPVVADPGP
ncbi:hypothetical protein ABZ639_19290 [Saccharomonospora sp. NPDC006951]